jgi:two-component system OmpR family response regulator
MHPGVRTAVVIDDDPDARLILKVGLSAGGFRVHEAATGAEGVELVRDLDPDLVTLDLETPGISGSEALRRIRAISAAHVILISAAADEADRLLGLAAGADDFMTKPFSPCEIQAHLPDLSGRAPMLREHSVPAQRGPHPMDRPMNTDVIRHGPLTVDTRSRCAWLLESELPLTGQPAPHARRGRARWCPDDRDRARRRLPPRPGAHAPACSQHHTGRRDGPFPADPHRGVLRRTMVSGR